MTKFKQIIFISFFSIFTLALSSCSDDKQSETKKEEIRGDHVWKNQTDALKSAKEKAKKMQQSIKQQQQTLDNAE